MDSSPQIVSSEESSSPPPASQQPNVGEGSSTSTLPLEQPETMKESRSILWLKNSDRLIAGILMLVCLVLIAAHWARISRWGTAPVEIVQQSPHSYEFRLNLNSATWLEFTLLEGIGETLAHRIVDDRETNGPFTSIDDLQRVKGIGPKTVEKLRPWLRIDEAASNDE